MSLTVTLTNRMTKEPVAYRAIQIKLDSLSDDLNVITDENGQFTIDEKYRNIEFLLEPKYIESGENLMDLRLGGWRNWESDTLNIPVSLSSGAEPRSLGAGITVALKIPIDVLHREDANICVNIPNPMEIEIDLQSPDVSPDNPRLKVTTDRNGLFLIDEKYRNFDCSFAEPSYVRSNWVKLDNNYVEMVLTDITYRWMRPE